MIRPLSPFSWRKPLGRTATDFGPFRLARPLPYARTSDRMRKSEKAPPRAPQRADAGPALACRLALALPAPPRGQDAITLPPTQSSRAHARARPSPDRIAHRVARGPPSPAESRAPAPFPGPAARPAGTGGRGRFPPPGGHGTQVARGSLVEIKGGFSKEDQQLRGNLPDGLPRKPEGFCGLGRPGLGSVRLSAPAETRSKPLRNGPENELEFARPVRARRLG